MLVLPSYQALGAALAAEKALVGPRVVVIGNFDGVHLGHQELFAEARSLAAQGPVTVVALTFWPHPARVLAPPGVAVPPLIQSRQRRRERLAECGVDVLIEQPFDLAFAALSPTAFVSEVLLRSLGASFVVVGHDFTFGKGRAGTAFTLREMLSEHGVAAHVVPAFTVSDPRDGQPIVCSSTFIRREVQAGRPERAALVLGRDVELEGVVVRGAARGRTIGFPTANLDCEAELKPAVGIYAAWADVLSAEKESGLDRERTLVPRRVLYRHPAAVSVGYNATFTAGEPGLPALSIEAHLIQRAPHNESPLFLYDQTLRLHLRARLRDEERFSSVEALVTQIHRDIAETLRQLGVTS
jgi:riboflavin kinase/FMN adenylyltransferase